MIFANVRNNEIIDFNSKYLDADIERIETTKEMQDAFEEDKSKVIYSDGEIIYNPNWEEEQEEKEKKRIAHLHLTRGDVFRGLLQARGVTRSQLRQIIENLPEENQEQAITKEMALIDFDEALEFYRGNALIETVGEMLGITSEMMDRFFETNDYRELQEAIQVEPDNIEETEEL